MRAFTPLIHMLNAKKRTFAYKNLDASSIANQLLFVLLRERSTNVVTSLNKDR